MVNFLAIKIFLFWIKVLPEWYMRYLWNMRYLWYMRYMVIFIQSTFILVTFVHIRNISSVTDSILTKFTGRLLWYSLTDANCHGDICPGNICPDKIGPCQDYLSCYWPDFDKTLKVASWEHLEQISTVTVTFVQARFIHTTFVLVTFVHIRNISAVTDTIWTKL